jgi:ribosomal protein L24E
MAIRRLKPDLGGLSGRAGVAVLMRYTLRLLTLQQFQRAATLICACEAIRRADPARWGNEPFRIGLWVGERSTPNWTKDAAEIINQDHNVYQAGGGVGGKGTPAQITNCPWCGRAIQPGRDINVETYAKGRGRTFQFCSDPTGECLFSRRQSPGEGLPIVVVDEEVYRRLPTLLIATVDKFAQMPWKGAVQMLFGRVDGYCPRHGYVSSEIEDAGSHPSKGNFPRVQMQSTPLLRPPDLIIQDELHLISGPLGSLVGLYETAVDELSTWELEGVKIRPKVIASTATIRRAKDQVQNLFLRDVKIFPPAGLDAEDNFFSKRVPSSNQTPGRLYIGVCAPGTRLKSILIRVYAAYMAAAQKLYLEYGRHADPWMTLIGYFNSIRELGGMRRVVDDALRTRLMQMDERGLVKRYISPMSVDELTSRKSGTDIPKILDRLDTVFDPELTEERKQKRRRGEKSDSTKYPLDVVLATNMISVGVDVSRLGLMVVASQPKATAEYIQATSRVGRVFPGIVCTVYNWTRPRDLSHYERFEQYHATYYQQVEALSVTPFSPRALDRGLSAVMVSILRQAKSTLNANERAALFQRSYEWLDTTVSAIIRRGEMIKGPVAGQLIREMLNARIDLWLNRIEQLAPPAVLSYAPKSGGLTIPLLKKPSEDDWEPFTCLNSLRDVEPGVALILNDYGMDRHSNHQPIESERKEGE